MVPVTVSAVLYIGVFRAMSIIYDGAPSQMPDWVLHFPRPY